MLKFHSKIVNNAGCPIKSLSVFFFYRIFSLPFSNFSLFKPEPYFSLIEANG